MPSVGKPLPHDAAIGHVTGRAAFVDDLLPMAGELCASFVGSPVAAGQLKGVDVSAALAVPGVVACFTGADVPGHRVLAFLATAPIAIPGIVLGVGLFLSYTRPPLVLYGTLWILLIAYITIELPAAYQQMQSAFRAVNPELEEASRILGATRLQALRHITARLLRTNVLATWCFIFVSTIRELSAAIMLFTSETKVVSVLIFDLKESGDLGAISVLGLSLLLLTFTVVIAVNRMPGFGGTRLRNT